MSAPFYLASPGSLTYLKQWDDSGTHGDDWGMIVSSVPAGYARLGDRIYGGGFPDGWAPIRQSGQYDANVYIPSPNELFVAANRPDVAVPCQGYNTIRDYDGDRHARIFIATHPDPNYVALGHICRKDKAKPGPGEYYMVHRKYLIDLGGSAPEIDPGGGSIQQDGTVAYRTVDSTQLFRFGDRQRWGLRTDATLQACCTGSGSSCEIFTKGSVGCQQAMSAYCSAEDIKPGGKCEDWCSKDPVNCDKLKQQFCQLHPTDPFCDCINAQDRQDYKDLVKGKEVIYNRSTPACFYARCKLGPYKVFTTTDQVSQQQGTACVSDLQYIDQAIKVAGDNNVLQTTQVGGTSADGKGSQIIVPGASDSSAISLTPMNILIMFIVLIILGAGGYYIFKSDDKPMYYQQQYYQQPQYYQPTN